MTRTPPQHGERRCYIAGCRRPECTAAHKRYCKAYRAATFHTGTLRHDTTAAAGRITRWALEGWSHSQMSQTTGCSGRVIFNLLNNGTSSINTATVRRILTAPEPTGFPYHAVTDATGTIRRGQGLHYIGYPIYRIAQDIPMATSHLGRLLTGQPETVRVSVAEGMNALYSRLAWTPGSSALARLSARRHGWHGPLAWDPATIDDPQALPDTADAYTPLHPNSYDPYRRSEIEHLLRSGASSDEIHKRTGASASYITQISTEMRVGRRRPLKSEQVAA